MKIKSEKACYSDELQRIALRFNAEYFVWGEELIDKKLIIYPKKLKGITVYEAIQDHLEPCGFVTSTVAEISSLRFSNGGCDEWQCLFARGRI